jgi:hypothetical protein
LLETAKPVLRQTKEVLIIVLSKDYERNDPISEEEVKCKLGKIFTGWKVETVNHSVID